MAHLHTVRDDDLYFTIDPISREITNLSGRPLTLMQMDHNSEELTFELPRYIEGHDMMLCTEVEIHYLNTGTGTSVSTRSVNPGVYDVTDLSLKTDDEESVIFHWLISQNVTRLEGTLKFQIKFICSDESGDETDIAYIWHTGIYSSGTILAGINNSSAIVEQHADILEQWRELLFEGDTVTDELREDVTLLQSQVADILYVKIAITSFKASPSVVEIGDIIDNVILSWSLNKDPSHPQVLTCDNDGLKVSIPINTRSYEHSQARIEEKATFTLEVQDERGYTASSSTASINFFNGVYYGAAVAPNTYNSEFILGLTKSLRSNKLTSFSATATGDQYIYYCVPTRFGKCSFTVGGFTGGFTLVDTIEFTNASGYKENYYIYRSDSANLGSTSVSVT